jgi:hypothetical protein
LFQYCIPVLWFKKNICLLVYSIVVSIVIGIVEMLVPGWDLLYLAITSIKICSSIVNFFQNFVQYWYTSNVIQLWKYEIAWIFYSVLDCFILEGAVKQHIPISYPWFDRNSNSWSTTLTMSTLMITLPVRFTKPSRILILVYQSVHNRPAMICTHH